MVRFLTDAELGDDGFDDKDDFCYRCDELGLDECECEPDYADMVYQDKEAPNDWGM